MTPWNSAAPAILGVTLAWGGAASADVTAEEVWSSWKSVVELSGQSVTATEERSGDTLILRDVTLTAMTAGSDGMTGRLGDLSLVEQADGTVRIEIAPEYPLDFRVTSATGETVEMAMTMRQPGGLSMVARGDAEAVAYDLAAPELALALDRMVVNGEPVDMAGGARIEALVGSYEVGAGEPRRIGSDFRADAVRLDMTATDPDAGGRMVLEVAAADLVSTSVSTLPAGLDMTDLARMLGAGFSSDGRLAYADMTYAMRTTAQDAATSIASSADGGSVDFALGDGEMVYDIRASGTRIVAEGLPLPVPQIDLAMDDSAFRIRLPLVESDTPRDFALSTRLAGLTVSDGLWGMLDPTGQLPRDPATLAVDLAGTARWLAAFGDPAAMAAGRPPVELSALNLKGLQLSLAGADLTGSGDFTFGNPGNPGFAGMPQPSGSLDLRLEGGNTLLDRLVAMGLVPPDQATGLRMMVGLFARPGEGADTLVSKIEVTEEGQVFANGQRLR